MTPKHQIRIGAVIIAVLLGYLAVGAALHANDSFDAPLRTTDVHLEQSPYLTPNARSHILLSCYYYPAFMIKQLDDPGLKGTRWVTILPTVEGYFPACRRSHAPKEQFIAKQWWTFIGVKGSLLFLEAADGSSGGMPFRILDLTTRKKIFEDSRWWNGRFEFVQTPDGEMSLEYLRVVEGNCSIPKDGESCWNEFRKKYGLPLATAPKCTGSEEQETIPTYEEPMESAIAYPVAVKLFPQRSIQAVSGPVKCRPRD